MWSKKRLFYYALNVILPLHFLRLVPLFGYFYFGFRIQQQYRLHIEDFFL